MLAGAPTEAVPTLSRRILLLEDDETLLRILAGYLRDEGHLVEATDDPVQALEFVGRSMWDLVVTDGGLKSSSGVEFASEVIRRELKIPMVLITGAVRFNQDRALFAEVLWKPFSRDEFVKTVREVLRRREGAKWEE